MNATLTLVDLAGTIALLMWGVHMVQTGIQRAFGPHLRRILGRAFGDRFRAFLAGLGVTAVLQSSTATGLMAASFAAGGLVDLVPALAVMLGANVGTTLIVQLLSFNISRVAPLFILIGVVLFRRSGQSRPRDLGRVAIGLGLMLMALSGLLALMTPYEDVPSLRLLMGAIATQPVIAVILAAGLTWLAHSSVATILLIVSLAANQVVPPEAAFALVLGANLGSALNPLIEGSGGDPVAKRLPMGNLLNRALGVVAGLALIRWIGPLMVTLDPNTARAVADFHTAFNLVMAALFLPVLGPFARLLQWMLPARAAPTDPSKPIYLDENAREMPAIALAGAAREALRMADVLEAMLRNALDALDRGDRNQVSAAKGLDDVLDRLNREIKVYLTGLDPDSLDDSDNRRLSEILTFVTNIEHAGDIVEKGLVAVASKRLKRGLSFSVEGQAEIRAMIERLAGNVGAAAAVFMTEDPRAARRLVAEEAVFRDLETRATETHFARIRAGRIESVETSALHLDVLRDLKRINGHLTAAADSVLDRIGELLPSRLRQDAPAAEEP
jgi:phosphate:Na+ symporter